MDTSKVKKFFDIKSLTWDQRKTRPIEVYDEFAKTYFMINEGDRVLDLGCGSGTFIPSLQKLSKAEVTGLDISDKMIELAKPKFAGNNQVNLLAGDFYTVEGLGQFDVIVCHNGISHFTDPIAFKDKCLKLLKPNGRLALTHFVDFEAINKRHSNMDPDIGRILQPAEEEVKVFLDDFEPVVVSNQPYYNITLKRK